jgi:phage terminase large subunit GpA-like protein
MQDEKLWIATNARNDAYDFRPIWDLDYTIPLISEWAAKDRRLPEGTTEFPGPIDHSIAPHMVEIQDCLHPDSGVRQLTCMKSTQSLFTTTIFNAFGHSIKYKLHNLLYIGGSKNISGILSSSAIDVMIDNSGLREYIKPISSRMKRKIADNKFYKELHGGRRLMMTSWNSIKDAKSLTWSLIFMDELDEAPYELAGQGDPESIFAGRGKTIRNLIIVKGSTPTNTNGRIYRNFLEGDQRYYFAQCQLCGEKQVLELYGLGREYGLRARSETISGVEQIIPDTVEYVCIHCKGILKEYQKGAMMAGGEWRPTARPVNIGYRSYQISNLMSPVMFYTWSRVMQEFCETGWGEKITKFKNFVIDVMGMPWEHRTEKLSWETLKGNAEEYELCAVSEGGLIVVSGTDVQKRWLEFIAVAYGPGMETWIIDHKKFLGDTKLWNNQVWRDWQNYKDYTKYKLTFRSGDQVKTIMLPIAMSAIDTGYNPKRDRMEQDGDITTEHTIYEVVSRSVKTIACRGNPDLRDAILKEERIKKNIALKTRYDLAVNDLKDEIMVKVGLPRNEDGSYPRGYIHFTKFLPDEFFKGFLSEVYAETMPGKWEYKKIYERNEPLDCYNLARGAAERLNLASWTDQVWENYKKQLFS